MWILTAILACSGSPPCEERAPGLERDQCLFDRVQSLDTSEWAAFSQQVEGIADPVIRGAAVYTWTQGRAGTLPQAARDPLCALLPHAERTACERRFDAAHLQR